MANSFLLPLLFVITINAVHSRSLPNFTSSELISDGLHTPNYLRLNPLSLSAEAESTCKQTYGFLPSSTTVLGNLFLIIVYGYLMFIAATYLAGARELQLEISGPSVVGGLCLPIFGAFPGAVIILGSGVSTDIWTCYAARIMAISIIPFIIVQLPQLLNSNSARRLAVLVALIVSVSLLISYCVYQVFQPWIQTNRIAYAEYLLVISGVLKHLQQRSLGRLLYDKGEPNIDVIKRSHDSLLDIDEFIAAVSKWLNVAKGGRPGSADAGPQTIKVLDDYHEQTQQEHALLGAEVQSDEIENHKWIYFKGGMMLLLGTIIAAAFADPLVDAVDNFSEATSIPSFFVSFIALPLATNSSEAVSAIIFASRKKIRNVSYTFSQLYGTITTNNVVSTSVFLFLVYVRELTWEFSSEVLIILIVCLVMGGLASFRTRFPLWTCSVAYILYPFSLALVYVLHYVFGWS